MGSARQEFINFTIKKTDVQTRHKRKPLVESRILIGHQKKLYLTLLKLILIKICDWVPLVETDFQKKVLQIQLIIF